MSLFFSYEKYVNTTRKTNPVENATTDAFKKKTQNRKEDKEKTRKNKTNQEGPQNLRRHATKKKTGK